VALIFAFRDKAGTWYGDPNGTRHEVTTRPVESTLPFHPAADEPGAASPFAGQTLQVVIGNIAETLPGRVRHLLGDATVRYAPAEVDELLISDDVHATYSATHR
jgi:hypothetical protein